MSSFQEQLGALLFRDDLLLEDIHTAQKLKYSKIPKSLYKYRALNKHSIKNLKERSLFCTTANAFNDPYDCAVNFTTGSILENKKTHKLLNEIEKDSIDQKDRIIEFLRKSSAQQNDEHVEKLNKTIQSMYKICSLSERVDSLLMWGHYASNHTGFAMEYDFSSLPEDHIMSLLLWPVFYGKKIYDVSGIVNSDKKEGINNLFIVASAMHKALDWEYEKEWRIIIPEGPDTQSRSLLAPLTAIHIGSKANKKDEVELLEMASELGIPAYKMKLSRTDYKMESILRQQPS
ncbi:DUF2971 domain-containing protein [Pseudomonas ovata]|uniref:DUF2971 domain-containing protein n=1 Tax=Pseudomonas ovata TaxID=1839709 RepID=UPI000D689C61|nr:DUF2971 domain-containing protein [Pseudomonas ovata]